MIRNVFVFGTIIEIIYSSEKASSIDKEILERLYQMDDECSLFKQNSDVSKINSNNKINEVIEVNEETIKIIKESLKYSKLTNGAVDITFRTTMEENRSEFDEKVNYKDIIIEEPNKIKFKKVGVKIDLGSIVKGYATDVVVEILNKNGIRNAIINLGGNVYAKGVNENGEKWKVGIQNPIKKTDKLVGYLEITNQSIVTSGTVERGNHIIDPQTGKVVGNHIKSVSIIADKSIDAEGLSTAFFVKGKEGIKEINKMERIGCIYIDDKKNIYLSNNLKEKFIVTNRKFKVKE